MTALATAFESPRESRRAETATRLLDTAWEIARDDGIGTLSLHELGRRLGMRQPSLYTYFDSKHGLFNLMCLTSGRELLARAAAAEPTGDAQADLREMTRVLVDFAREDLPRADLLLRPSIPGFTPSPAAAEPLDEFWALFAARCRAAGITRRADVDVVVAALTGLIDAQLTNDPSGTRWTRHSDRLLSVLHTGFAEPSRPTPSLGRVTTYVALLRGINVGGSRKVAMSDLRDLFGALGHTDVVTYVQSGNVVFRARGGGADAVRKTIEKRIAKDLGHDVAVILRTAAQLRAVVTGQPFGKKIEPSKVGVAFLGDVPSKTAVKKLDPERYAPERFVVKRSDVYLSYPNGFGRAKLTNTVLEKQLGTAATIRNWNTVTKLLELAGG